MTLWKVILLGRCYICDTSLASFHYINDTPTNSSSSSTPKFLNSNKNNNNSSPHIAKFIKDFESLLWFSYRKDFPPIGPAEITSDIGWGCMLRTGQMMLAEAFIFCFLGRGMNANLCCWLLIHIRLADKWARFATVLCLQTGTVGCCHSCTTNCAFITIGIAAVCRLPCSHFSFLSPQHSE